MRSKTATNVYASRLFCLGIVFTMIFALTGCGGSGGATTGNTTTTVTSVAVNPTTANVAPGGNITFDATVVGANNPSQVVNWSVSPTSAGTISGGTFTASASITTVTQAQVCANSTVPDYTSMQGCAQVSINPVTPPPPTVTSVSTGATSATVTAGQTDTVTPTVVGTGSYTNTVNISVSPSTAGTLSVSSNVPSGTQVTFTASASITTVTQAIVTSCSTMAGYTTVCGPTTITINPVTPPPPTVTSVTVTCSLNTITTAQTSTCVATVHYNDGSTSAKATFALTSGSVGSITAAGVYSSAAAGTGNVVATSTENTSISSSPFAITVTAVVTPPTITGVSLPCTSTDITNIQATTCTPQVAGTGAYTNTVNLTLTPASAGTLSASTNVASGTAVTFTPTFNMGAQTPTITATSTEDPTKSSGAVEITVTLRTIAINSPTGNIWLATCAQLFFYSVAQTGIVNGDTLYINPYAPATFTSTPGSTFQISLGIGNDPSGSNPCSPGAYDEYVSGTDGARSNDQYIPILSPFNMWAGYNGTDEFQVDFAANCIQPYKLTDGTKDGSCLPNTAVTLVAVVDGNNILTSKLGNTGIGVYNISTGKTPVTVGSSDGSTIVDFAAKNGIAAYTTTEPEVGFSMESFYTANNLPNVGTAPSAIVGSTGCNTNPNAASFFSYDNAGSTLYRSDVVGNVASGAITSKSVVNQVTLSGFSPASALPANLARYVGAWDTSCKAVVLAPVTTGGTNPDGTTAYVMELALVDMTSGSARQLGTYVSTGIPSTAIRMAADPSGNDVVIASTNQAAGTTVFTKVSWTLDANENPTFSVTTLASAPPTGVYGVSLGILPSNLVPNGTVIRVGQRQQHYALANQ